MEGKTARKPTQTAETQPIVTVSERAATELKTALAAQTETFAGVRIGLQAGGCCGPGYVLMLAERQEADDLVVDAHGVKILVNASQRDGIVGSKLDFVETPMGSGFHVENPNVVKEEHSHGGGGCGSGGCGSGGGCGCGSGGGHGGHGHGGSGGCGC